MYPVDLENNERSCEYSSIVVPTDNMKQPAAILVLPVLQHCTILEMSHHKERNIILTTI
jgi:hypothetical protein